MLMVTKKNKHNNEKDINAYQTTFIIKKAKINDSLNASTIDHVQRDHQIETKPNVNNRLNCSVKGYDYNSISNQTIKNNQKNLDHMIYDPTMIEATKKYDDIDQFKHIKQSMCKPYNDNINGNNKITSEINQMDSIQCEGEFKRLDNQSMLNNPKQQIKSQTDLKQNKEVNRQNESNNYVCQIQNIKENNCRQESKNNKFSNDKCKDTSYEFKSVDDIVKRANHKPNALLNQLQNSYATTKMVLEPSYQFNSPKYSYKINGSYKTNQNTCNYQDADFDQTCNENNQIKSVLNHYNISPNASKRYKSHLSNKSDQINVHETLNNVNNCVLDKSSISQSPLIDDYIKEPIRSKITISDKKTRNSTIKRNAYFATMENLVETEDRNEILEIDQTTDTPEESKTNYDNVSTCTTDFMVDKYNQYEVNNLVKIKEEGTACDSNSSNANNDKEYYINKAAQAFIKNKKLNNFLNGGNEENEYVKRLSQLKKDKKNTKIKGVLPRSSLYMRKHQAMQQDNMYKNRADFLQDEELLRKMAGTFQQQDELLRMRNKYEQKNVCKLMSRPLQCDCISCFASYSGRDSGLSGVRFLANKQNDMRNFKNSCLKDNRNSDCPLRRASQKQVYLDNNLKNIYLRESVDKQINDYQRLISSPIYDEYPGRRSWLDYDEHDDHGLFEGSRGRGHSDEYSNYEKLTKSASVPKRRARSVKPWVYVHRNEYDLKERERSMMLIKKYGDCRPETCRKMSWQEAADSDYIQRKLVSDENKRIKDERISYEAAEGLILLMQSLGGNKHE